MGVKKYLEDKLKNCSKYELTDLDKKFLSKYSVADFIFQKLTSKKFRKWAINDDSVRRVKEAIRVSMDKNEPIKFTYPFGGYKLWRIPTAPEVDWAEFLMISYYVNYVAPILQTYEPGVEFVFSSDDLIIERMNNIPKEDTDAYFSSFTKLINAFSEYFPSNMKMEIKQVSSLYEKDELEQELSGHFERIKKAYLNMDEKRKESMLKTSELNIKMQGVKDWTKLGPDEQQEKLGLGLVYHDAQCSLVKRGNFVRGEDKIVLFTTVIPNAIAIGTTKTSITKFWTGYGVLEKHGDIFKDRILSPKQLIEAGDMQAEEVDLINLKNFKNINLVN